MTDIDLCATILRLSLGGTVLAHGVNHAFGGGKLAGTARWFSSLGMRAARVHALLATVVEIGAGILLLLGALTSLACAAVVGTMGVALVANHWRNGFFIFRPGEGYEYVLMIAMTASALGALGAGRLSVDHALDLSLSGGAGFLVAAGGGAFGAAGLLLTCWRPVRTAAS